MHKAEFIHKKTKNKTEQKITLFSKLRIKMNDTVKNMRNVSCVTWQTALYLEIVCAQGFESVWIWMSSSHILVV